MKKILLYSLDAAFREDVILNPKFEQNFNEPFLYLKEELKTLGYDLSTSPDDLSDIEKYDCILFIDSPFAPSYLSGIKNRIKSLLKKSKYKYSNEKKIKEFIKKNSKTKIALFLWEGQAVRPHNYKKSLHKLFSIIFTWNDDLADGKKFHKFYLPFPTNFPEIIKKSFDQKKLLINITANKGSNNYKYKNELYSERIKSIQFFEKNYPNDFDLYGVGWKKEENPSYRGGIKHKSDVLPSYKFSLCYENLKNENGYITEKIFDCFMCGTVPIYWGANNIEKYVDKEAFIDKRLFKTDEEIANHIINMRENEYNNYIKAIDNYLNSEKFQLFLSTNFANTIINTLKL